MYLSVNSDFDIRDVAHELYFLELEGLDQFVPLAV
jgi:hypothetical protein